jgi:hypothetical protein
MQERVAPTIIPALYADLPTSPGTLTATFADYTSILTTVSDPVVASQLLQTDLLAIQNWLKTQRTKVNENKSTHVTFNMSRGNQQRV